MVGKRNSVLFDPFAPRHRHRPGVKKMLLVDQNEQNIVAAGGCGRRCHPRFGRLRGRRQAGKQTANPKAGEAAGQQAAARRVAKFIGILTQNSPQTTDR